MKLLTLEEHVGNHAEDNKGDDFLNDFQLHQRKRPTIVDESDAVRRHQEAVLNAGDAPREEYHGV